MMRNIAPDPHERDIVGRSASASAACMRSFAVFLPEVVWRAVTLRSTTDLHAQDQVTGANTQTNTCSLAYIVVCYVSSIQNTANTSTEIAQRYRSVVSRSLWSVHGSR